MLNIDRLREETPACSELIHFNNAGASLQPQSVTDAVLQYLTLEQRLGGYEAAEAQHQASEHFYTAVAGLLNCNPREVAYAENSTRAWNLLLHAIAFEPGERIIIGESEYASNYLSLLELAHRHQVNIEVINNDDNGLISLQALEQRLDENVRLIALTHVASQNGVIQPVAEVGKLARKHNILYLIDACQSAGQLHIDVNDINCDMLTASGRKYLRGPRGTGFMYVRHSVLNYLKPDAPDLQSVIWTSRDQFSWRDDARRFELWEHNVAARIGLTVAADYATALGVSNIEKRIKTLANELRCKLSELPRVQIHDQAFATDSETALNILGGIVSFSVKNADAVKLQTHLRQHRINTSVIRRNNTRLEFEVRDLPDINRASVHYFNTSAEIDAFCQAVRTFQV
ncbi:aminotransferase class V-fold PLP-dependent enzyme [Pseudohongiella spirulinae]|uniref:Aminotransferase, class V superfamily n=1 Tax=Pseudohongiella spirulinae TaxID=1249552 RepID=A0A0S2KFC1_9GAMM|nr:aminotransferase class V-fold PLP-dependent enzyme [Pseudohongiella spirulinae]ALO46803.1 Aminotransferase, class V superfamily [Pseudohongiella spirulinae]